MGSRARRIGPWTAAALVVANMIGAGVFTTSGFALADLGDRRFVMLAWVVGGVLALCGALSYGALARRIPESGGEYTFLTATVSPLAGFLAGWVSLLAGFTAPIAAAALGLQAYLAAAGGPLGGLERPAWIGSGSTPLPARLVFTAAMTMTIVTRPADGMPAAPIAASVAVIMTISSSATDRSMLYSWKRKTTATAS